MADRFVRVSLTITHPRGTGVFLLIFIFLNSLSPFLLYTGLLPEHLALWHDPRNYIVARERKRRFNGGHLITRLWFSFVTLCRNEANVVAFCAFFASVPRSRCESCVAKQTRITCAKYVRNCVVRDDRKFACAWTIANNGTGHFRLSSGS